MQVLAKNFKVEGQVKQFVAEFWQVKQVLEQFVHTLLNKN